MAWPSAKLISVLSPNFFSAPRARDGGVRAARRFGGAFEGEVVGARVVGDGVVARVLGDDRQVVGFAGARRRAGGAQLEVRGGPVADAHRFAFTRGAPGTPDGGDRVLMRADRDAGVGAARAGRVGARARAVSRGHAAFARHVVFDRPGTGRGDARPGELDSFGAGHGARDGWGGKRREVGFRGPFAAARPVCRRACREGAERGHTGERDQSHPVLDFMR